MKRISLHFLTAILTFLISISIVLFVGFRSQSLVKPIKQKDSVEKFPIKLEPINLGDNGFYDVAYLDKNTVLSVTVRDGMQISKNHGRTWERMFVKTSGFPPQTGGWTLQSLSFIDSQKGWASGSVVISTKDGGRTWKEVKLPRWMRKIKVNFLNESIGYIVGSIAVRDKHTDVTKPGIQVYKTVNGGKTWRKSYSDSTSHTPWEILTLDEKTTLLIIDGNILLRTENGGKTWQKVYERLYGGVKSVSQSPDGNLWLFGNDNILFSTDFGKTWRKPKSLSNTIVNHDWWSVDFNKKGLGVAVSEDAAIALTKDGGKTWSEVKSNLHYEDRIYVPNNPFNEALRGIHLSKDSGIVLGSQKDYIISFP